MKVELIDNSATILLPELFDYYLIKNFISNSQQFSECDSIVIDFKNTKYIDSPAIATLFRLRQIVNERDCVKIINIRRNLYELLVMTGYVGLLGENNFLVK
ncbi:MAG: STAS domain-containing protein [Magnetococcales bacterium]|nr:STAS domain-containing protein [Magnetococcales bacterium]